MLAIAVVLFAAIFSMAQYAETKQLKTDFVDFRSSVWKPGHLVIHGRSPYEKRSASSMRRVPPFVYPPPILLASLPLIAVDYSIGKYVWALILLSAAGLTLVVLRVRDPVCWAVWLLSAPVVQAVLWGNVTPLVLLATAAVWRWRERSLVAGLALATAVSIKLFLAPLALWLVFTRRWRAAMYAAAASTALVFGAWAIIGFRGLLDYPALLHNLSLAVGVWGFLAQGLVIQAGVSTMGAAIVGVASGTTLLCLAWCKRDDDRSAFALALAASLLISPVGWMYYLGLLVILIAERSPRFSLPWTALLALWAGMTYFRQTRVEDLVTTSFVLAVFLTVVAMAVYGEPTPYPHPQRTSLPSRS